MFDVKNMIAGNPKTDCTVLIIVAALATLVLLCTVFFSLRKKTDPQKEPPLHPFHPSVVLAQIERAGDTLTPLSLTD